MVQIPVSSRWVWRARTVFLSVLYVPHITCSWTSGSIPIQGVVDTMLMDISSGQTVMTDVVLQQVRRQVCEAQEQWRRASTDDNETKMPFVTLSYAQSIDGSLAVERGAEEK